MKTQFANNWISENSSGRGLMLAEAIQFALFESESPYHKLSDRIEYTSPTRPLFSDLIFPTPSDSSNWLSTSKESAALITAGPNLVYANLCLEQASNLCSEPPRIYQAPEGGIVFEHRNLHRKLTLVIENQLGLIIASSPEVRTNAEFEISFDSINEFLARYVIELRIMLDEG